MSLRTTLIRLAHSRTELRTELLSVLASNREATVFPTEEALKKYLHEHPDADASKHSVKPSGKKEDGKKKEESNTDSNPFHAPEAATRTKATIDHASKAYGQLKRQVDQAKRLTSYKGSDPVKAKAVASQALAAHGDMLDNGVQLMKDIHAIMKSKDSLTSEQQEVLSHYTGDPLDRLEKQLHTSTEVYHAQDKNISGENAGKFADVHVGDLAGDAKKLHHAITTLEPLIDLFKHKSWDKAYGKSASLHDSLVRLAHKNPSMRPHLLPILTAAPTANQQYQEVYREVQATLKAMEKVVDAHAARQAKQPLDWGYVGDMTHIRDTLHELVDNFKV